jgi:hypothetical protein
MEPVQVTVAKAMVHANPRKPAGVETGPGKSARCAECCAALAGSQPGQMFCGPKHRNAFQDRMRQRGRQLVPYAMADRLTRSGTAGDPEDREAGKASRAVTQRLIAKWAAEDKAAGRLPMTAYVRRLAKHHDLPL